VGLLVVQLDHAAHLYNNLDPVSRTDLLAAVGEHIRGAIPQSALLGFYDAACFVVALPNCAEETLAAAARALVSALGQPLRFKTGELHLTVSVGFSHAALFNDPQRLWTSAWRAMRAAVGSGGNRARGPADDGVSRRLTGAMERDEFSLVLQPQMDAEGTRLTGAEALLRWHGMEVGELAPDHFIPVAEQRGHMAHLGDWVLDNACRDAATWFEHLVEPLWLGINFSPQQFRGRAIVDRIGRYRSEHWFDPALLELELPHEAMLTLVDEHREQLYQLRDWGVRFALDNLGSSLIDAAKLLRCPADTLKIDRAVISRVDTDAEARDLAAQICQLGVRFDLRVVAVGVEREAQQRVLSELGCSDFQGYLYSPPVSLQTFRSLLAKAPAVARTGH
jgi:EAL domain-containing protein (putative c-di-GMP-specific phosphodiesterase class I)